MERGPTRVVRDPRDEGDTELNHTLLVKFGFIRVTLKLGFEAPLNVVR